MIIDITDHELEQISGGKMCDCLCTYQGQEYYLGKRGKEINCIMDCRGRGLGYAGCV